MQFYTLLRLIYCRIHAQVKDELQSGRVPAAEGWTEDDITKTLSKYIFDFDELEPFTLECEFIVRSHYYS